MSNEIAPRPAPLDLDIQSLLALDPSDPEQATQLRVGIARAAGWKIEIRKRKDEIEVQFPVMVYRIVDPMGNPAVREYAYGFGDDWPEDGNDWPEDELDEVLPPYETSLDAALTLPLDDVSVRIDLFDHVDMHWGQVYIAGIANEVAEREKLAHTYCKAWLRYVARRERAETKDEA